MSCISNKNFQQLYMHTDGRFMFDENGNVDPKEEEFDINQEVLERYQRITIRGQGKQLDYEFGKVREEFIDNYTHFKEKLDLQRKKADEESKRISETIKPEIEKAVIEGRSSARIFLYISSLPSTVEHTTFHSLILITNLLEYCKKNNLIGEIERESADERADLYNFFLRIRWL